MKYDKGERKKLGEREEKEIRGRIMTKSATWGKKNSQICTITLPTRWKKYHFGKGGGEYDFLGKYISLHRCIRSRE